VSVTATLVAFVAVVAVVALAALVANDAVPCKEPVKVVEETDVRPAKVVDVAPNAILVEPTVTELFAKLVLGIAAKPNVNVSLPAEAAMVRPCPEDEANNKDPEGESAIRDTPLYDAVAKAFLAGAVAFVKYPASLFNWDTLLPDTMTFFHVAIIML
jgi:hypothetical protein